jgi:hypothetical protein
MEDALNQVVKALVEALGLAILALVTELIRRMVKRIGLTISAQQMTKIEEAAKRAILSVEERAEAAAANGLARWSPDNKLQDAISKLLELFPGMTAEEASDHIHAALPTVNLGASAAVVMASVPVDIKKDETK